MSSGPIVEISAAVLRLTRSPPTPDYCATSYGSGLSSPSFGYAVYAGEHCLSAYPPMRVVPHGAPRYAPVRIGNARSCPQTCGQADATAHPLPIDHTQHGFVPFIGIPADE